MFGPLSGQKSGLSFDPKAVDSFEKRRNSTGGGAPKRRAEIGTIEDLEESFEVKLSKEPHERGAERGARAKPNEKKDRDKRRASFDEAVWHETSFITKKGSQTQSGFSGFTMSDTKW